MNKEYFISLFEYDRWANKQIADVLTNNLEVPSKCIILFHHMCAATETWLSRVKQIDRHYNSLFEESDLKINSEMIINLDNKWIDFLKDTVEITKLIKYQNTKGIEFKNSLIDVITQVLTHNHYHRGQINQLLRQAEIEPALTDYIFYKRQ